MQETRESIFYSFAAILSIIAVIMLIMAINKSTEANDLQAKIDKMNKEKDNRIAYNKDIAKKNEEESEKVGIDEVSKEADVFNDKFFNWGDWGEFTKNRKDLRSLYPNINEGKVVDISGMDVGSNSNKLKSNHSTDRFIGSQNNKIGEMITQFKSSDTGGKTDGMWYKVSEMKDGKYEVVFMEKYEKVGY